MSSGVSPRMVKLATVIALVSVIGAIALGGGTAPAQTGFLACVKTTKPGKGLLRMSGSGSCRANERGIRINQTGPQGPAGTPGGPQGPQGIQGPMGNPGTPGVSGYAITTPATSPAQSDATETQDVTCPGSKTVLGGGYQIARTDSSDKVVATESYPLSSSTWRVTAELISSTTPGTPTGTWTVTAIATCATVSA